MLVQREQPLDDTEVFLTNITKSQYSVLLGWIFEVKDYFI